MLLDTTSAAPMPPARKELRSPDLCLLTVCLVHKVREVHVTLREWAGSAGRNTSTQRPCGTAAAKTYTASNTKTTCLTLLDIFLN